MLRPKKSLGQHFLIDKNITEKIALSLTKTDRVIEVGPGEGALTDFYIKKENTEFFAIETDREAYEFLKGRYPFQEEKLILANFLKLDLSTIFDKEFSIIGNFPYNISSQIFFKVIDDKELVSEVVCMIQKEVAERLASKEGSKKYGILSVLLQAYYDIEYLFTVNENVFNPPPKVKSGVIRLTRNKTKKIDCNEKLFKQLIKASFNQRRKMLRVSLKSYLTEIDVPSYEMFTKRPEQLSVNEFVELTNIIENANS